MKPVKCKIRNRMTRWLGIGGCLLLLAGCGSSSDRAALAGAVTFDGAPLSKGSITFLPQLGTRGPAAGGSIEQGRFEIDREGGTFVGTFAVQITATRKTGRKVKTLIGTVVDGEEQYVPARYNRQSELTAEVTPRGRIGSNLPSMPTEHPRHGMAGAWAYLWVIKLCVLFRNFRSVTGT
ncbi:MAG: hypothetical protein GXP28_06050 [Planctomycetes bacterium]|nr:hypothetical protein [Planctomycetota bacterium]